MGISATAGLNGIVSGPDGALYFTEGTANKIGRITTAGVVTEYSVGISSGATPTNFVAGSNGNIYFTEPGISKIGKLTI